MKHICGIRIAGMNLKTKKADKVIPHLHFMLPFMTFFHLCCISHNSTCIFTCLGMAIAPCYARATLYGCAVYLGTCMHNMHI